MLERASRYLFAIAIVLGSKSAFAQSPPSTPATLTATPGDWQVSLTWSASGGNPISYTLKRSTVSGGPYTSVYSGAATTFADTATPNFRTYYYVVSASNASGSSPDSIEAHATPTSACGPVGTVCGQSTGSCTLVPTCQGGVIIAGRVPFSVPEGQTSGLIALAPAVRGTTNMSVEIGTVNIPGIPPVAAEMDTVIYLYREPQHQQVATNDDWQGKDLRSYLSYADTVTPLYATVTFSFSVRCKKPSFRSATCNGVVGFRIIDQTHTSCLAEVLAPQGTVCRPASGLCDLAESCDGRSSECPADAIADDHTVCRPASGVCDVEERCTGASKTCPDDREMPAGAVCRASVGACDPAETCNGTAKSCPANMFAPASTVCRPALGPCDTDKMCSGSSGVCPTDTDFVACQPLKVK